jgi:hypothetical protein
MLFVMLRDLLGEDAFQRGLRTFWQEQRFRVATWGDLQRAFEQASGQVLTSFFRQWLYRPGAPQPRIAGASAVASSAGYRLRFQVTQGAPAYALRLPIELDYGDAVESRTLSVDGAQQTLMLAVDRLPKSVRLDPDLRLWRSLDAEQLPPILRQWIVAREARLLQVSALPEVRAAATALAGRVFEAPPREIALDELRRVATPVLLVGLHAEIDAALAAAKLPPRPPDPGQRGTAQVWTVPGRTALAVISARRRRPERSAAPIAPLRQPELAGLRRRPGGRTRNLADDRPADPRHPAARQRRHPQAPGRMRPMLVLGIESSCDETGIALYSTDAGGALLAHALHSQVCMHADYGGVVPELASRDHVRRLVPLLRQVLADSSGHAGRARRRRLHAGAGPRRRPAGRRRLCRSPGDRA